jgi:hypothetical protein
LELIDEPVVFSYSAFLDSNDVASSSDHLFEAAIQNILSSRPKSNREKDCSLPNDITCALGTDESYRSPVFDNPSHGEEPTLNWDDLSVTPQTCGQATQSIRGQGKLDDGATSSYDTFADHIMEEDPASGSDSDVEDAPIGDLALCPPINDFDELSILDTYDDSDCDSKSIDSLSDSGTLVRMREQDWLATADDGYSPPMQYHSPPASPLSADSNNDISSRFDEWALMSQQCLPELPPSDDDGCLDYGDDDVLMGPGPLSLQIPRPPMKQTTHINTNHPDFDSAWKNRCPTVLNVQDRKTAKQVMVLPGGTTPLTGLHNANKFFIWNYFWLFPNRGLGAPENTDQLPFVSLRRWAKHTLMRNESILRTDETLMLVAQNIINVREVARHVSARITTSAAPVVHESISAVTSKDVEQVLAYHKSQRFKKAKRPLTAEEQLAQDKVTFLQRQFVLVGKHLPTSDFERSACRPQIYGLMVEFGVPTFFLTVNPYTVHHPLTFYFGKNDVLDAIDKHMSFQDRTTFESSHPAAAAKFFHRMITKMREILLGIHPNDPSQNTPGILGTVTCDYSTVEVQQSGRLHSHGLYWVLGATDPETLRQKMKDNPQFREDFVSYLRLVMMESFPSDKPPASADDDEGWNSDAEGEPSAYINPHEDGPLHRHSLRRVIPDRKYLTAGPQRRQHVHLMLACCQKHKHSPCCYKYNHKTCRFCFKRPKRKNYTIDADTGLLTTQRLRGWLVTSNACILQSMLCNHEISLLTTGRHATIMAFYCTDYSTKLDASIYNTLPLVIGALKKFELRTFPRQYDSKTLKVAQNTARLKMNMCLNQLTTHQEKSAATVNTSILGLPYHYTSNKFQSINMPPFLVAASMLFEEHEPDDEKKVWNLGTSSLYYTDNKEYVQVNAMLDFTYRPISMLDWGVYLFRKFTTKVKCSKESCLLNRCHEQFRTGHPQRKSHHLMLPLLPKTPVLFGPRIPRQINDPEGYAKMCMILFCPCTFETTGKVFLPLKRTKQSWPEAFEAWKTTLKATDPILTFLRNINLISEGRELRDKHQTELEQLRANQKLYKFDKSIAVPSLWDDYDEDDNFLEQHLDLDDMIQVQEDSSFCLRKFYSISNNHNGLHVALAIEKADDYDLFNLPRHVATSQLQPPTQASNHVHNHHYVMNSEPRHVNKMIRRLFAQTLKAKQNQRIIQQCPAVTSNSQLTTHRQGPDQHSDQKGVTIAYPESVIRRKIQNICLQRRLNIEQTRSFLALADNFKARLLYDQDEKLFEEPKPVHLLTLGEGGTGKSAIIHAIIELFNAFGKRGWLRTTSYTGNAAALIDGSTADSMFKLDRFRGSGQGESSTSSHGSNKSTAVALATKEKLQKDWKHVYYVIFDEFSMIGKVFLNLVHKRCQIAKNSDKLMGSISFSFYGDFTQYPCLGDDPLYKFAATENIDNQSLNCDAIPSTDKVRGRQLWLRLTKNVIGLTFNYRAAGDPHYAAFLSRLRTGDTTDEDVLRLKQREIEKLSPETLATFCDAKLAAPGNEMKDCYYWNQLQTWSSKLQEHTRLLIVRARDRFQKKPVPPPYNKELLRKGSQGFGYIPGFLGLIPGLELTIKQNLAPELGIANGNTFDYYGLIPHPDEPLLEELAKPGPPIILTHLPLAILLKTHNPKFDAFPGLPPGVFPVKPSHSSFEYRPKRPGEQKAPMGTRKGYKLVCGNTRTGYSIQGCSYDKLLISLDIKPKFFDVYVLLSRVRGYDGLCLLQPILAKSLRQKPTKINDIISENRRLLNNARTFSHSNKDLFTIYGLAFSDTPGSQAVKTM